MYILATLAQAEKRFSTKSATTEDSLVSNYLKDMAILRAVEFGHSCRDHNAVSRSRQKEKDAVGTLFQWDCHDGDWR